MVHRCGGHDRRGLIRRPPGGGGGPAPRGRRAIAPFVTPDQYYDGWAYQGGAFQLGFNLHWTLTSLALGEVVRRMKTGAATGQDFGALVAAVDSNDEVYARL